MDPLSLKNESAMRKFHRRLTKHTVPSALKIVVKLKNERLACSDHAEHIKLVLDLFHQGYHRVDASKYRAW